VQVITTEKLAETIILLEEQFGEDKVLRRALWRDALGCPHKQAGDVVAWFDEIGITERYHGTRRRLNIGLDAEQAADMILSYEDKVFVWNAPRQNKGKSNTDPNSHAEKRFVFLSGDVAGLAISRGDFDTAYFGVWDNFGIIFLLYIDDKFGKVVLMWDEDKIVDPVSGMTCRVIDNG